MTGYFSVMAPHLLKENPPVLLIETRFPERADHAE
jgi:hypothetical protein